MLSVGANVSAASSGQTHPQAVESGYKTVSQILTPDELRETQELKAQRGDVVKLDDSQIQSIANQHFHELMERFKPKKEKTFTLIMGTNGSGKTSQIVPELIKENGNALVIGTDEIRHKVADAFREQQGGDVKEPLYTQTAARAASIAVQKLASEEGVNTITTTVGYDEAGVARILDAAKENGYEERNLVLASLPPEQAVKRLYSRNHEAKSNPGLAVKQPFVDPSYPLASEKYPVTPSDVFSGLSKEMERYGLSSATSYSTDVESGERPVLMSKLKGAGSGSGAESGVGEASRLREGFESRFAL